MNRSSTVFLAILATVFLAPASSISAERRLAQAFSDAGRATGTAFLQELVDPARTTYQVGVVVSHTGMITRGSAFLISRKGAAPAVEYIAGRDYSSIPRMVARDQLANPNTELLHFTVFRKIIDSGNCPALTGAVADFYARLETTLSAPVHLADSPPRPESVISDAPDYVVQVALAGWATLSINHMGAWDHPLMRATGDLHEVLERCAASIEGSEEQTYTFSWGRAVLLKRADARP